MNHWRHSRRRLITYAALAALALGTAWNVAGIFRRGKADEAATCLVQVSGNVRNPGRYRVPRGTSQFEILRVAGVNPTSDITVFDLSAQIDADAALAVGTAAQAVSLKEAQPEVGLEFYFGEVTIIGADGRTRATQEGMRIDQGDRVLTEARSQAEFSVNAYSRVDIDDFSEITFDKIGEPEGGKSLVSMYQQSGTCWYKMAYAERADLFRIVTPVATITVAGTGADCVVEVKPGEVTVHCLDGLLLAERPSGEETINLIAGQSMVAFGDGRPFQVRGVAPDVSPNERFSQLVKAKRDFMMRQMPLSMMIYGVPDSYYLVNVQFDRSSVQVVHIPARITVEQFVEGVGTLDQALLRGGPTMAGTVIERIVNIRVPQYFMVSRDDVLRIVTSLGNLTVDVDPKAATALNVRSGRQRLTAEQIVKFLGPTVSGWDDARLRQAAVLKGIFQGMQTKSIVISALVANQLTSGVETSLTSTDIMNEYGKFTSHKTWSYKLQELPATAVTRGGQIDFEPMLDQCRALFGEG